MELTFLGTGAMMPTRERNTNAIFLSLPTGDGILVDCGEGTQRQFRFLDHLRPTRISHILLTHWHGDHVLGLPGLVQTLAASQLPKPPSIYGPPGTLRRWAAMQEATVFGAPAQLSVSELDGGTVYQSKEFTIEALPLRHRVECLGYRVKLADRRHIDMDAVRALGLPQGPLLGRLQAGQSVEWDGRTIEPDQVSQIVPGKRIAFVIDTAPCPNAEALARDADLLVCEATFMEQHRDEAVVSRHLTARQAAALARAAGARRLVLTHFSQRYESLAPLKDEAAAVFPGVTLAYDRLTLQI